MALRKRRPHSFPIPSAVGGAPSRSPSGDAEGFAGFGSGSEEETTADFEPRRQTTRAVADSLSPLQGGSKLRASGPWGKSTSALAVGAVVGGVLVFGGGIFLKGRPEKVDISAASPPVSVSVLDGDQLAPPPQAPLNERAARGEPSAVEALREMLPSERGIDETLALHEAGAVEEVAAAVRLLEKLGETKISEWSGQEKNEVLALVGSALTYREVLGKLAARAEPESADLIYRAARIFRSRPEVVALAHALLSTGGVRSSASPSLQVLIDSLHVSECGEARALLERAEDVGDSRSVRHLARLAKTQGCGASGQDDCFPCLRSDKLVVEALRKAQSRTHY